MQRPLVVKIGGSLISHVTDIVPILRHAGRPVLVIPGGGPFADLVRKFHINDESSHWMAVAAMEEYGWYIGGHGIPVTDRLAVPDRTHVYLPYRGMITADPLPHSWDVSSDTIAAWIADQLGLDLVLLKSVDGVTVNGSHLAEIREPVICSELDPCFIRFVLGHRMRATVINGLYRERIEGVLAGKPVLGTTIYTTF
jgi:aspartokinase-like uncharacterized kinase